MGDINNIEQVEFELKQGTQRLHRLIHFYETFDYNFPSFSYELSDNLIHFKTLIIELKLLLEKQQWDKIEDVKKKMLLILQSVQQYQMALRNNQEEYELLLKIQRDYQSLIIELNLFNQNQKKWDLAYKNTLAASNQKALINTPPVYSSLPRLEPKFQPFLGTKKDLDSV
jgi:hypothetical protein